MFGVVYPLLYTKGYLFYTKYVIYLRIVLWYYPLFVAICEIWLLKLTYGAYLVLSLKSGITKIFFAECQRKTHGKEFSDLWNSNVVFAWQDDFKTKGYQLQSFITFWDLQSLFIEFFHPRFFIKIKI